MTIAELSARIPFHANLDIRVLHARRGDGRALLPAHPHLLNHAATVHAGALFTLADVAAGAAVLPLVWDRVDEVSFVARGAEVRYLRPARGPITAAATCDADVEVRGKVDVPVAVTLTDEEGVQVAAMTVVWHLRPA
ncbi:PaaI family thioesterase [Kutzneria buriramensis]|uniref:Uncharacterized protein (TIGR00369 family) n=1 Tax=Kutzneria buriramensis TaxID=1045776 RepID=A0A3E0H2M1_9PSEU|nr:DUF4442 domain-containing protein [Kutzneria buriramensis]REH37041.1 uncharacterized protein (TIGR00369 family) [Kutzneria buriramensis]